MKKRLTYFFSVASGVAYRQILKRILFSFPADQVHEFFLRTGRRFGRRRSIRRFLEHTWRYDDLVLEQDLCGLHFKNPIGLSAGFDYNADLVRILPSVGFGFHTIGTLTYHPYDGNDPPMLGRLPKSRSLLVNKGFKNKGVGRVLADLPSRSPLAPRGVSIGATNKPYPDFEAMIDDLIDGFRTADRFPDFDYYELNISCPNLLNLQNLKEQISSPSGLHRALVRLEELRLERPIFVKMPLERSHEEMRALIEAMRSFACIRGLIFSNLAKDRTNPAFDPDEIRKAGKGNFSGKPVEEQSNEMIRFAHGLYPGRFLIIGVGGVFTAEDAYKKILCGASLVQMITGMVYMGPQQIGLINRGLVRLLEKDGYRSIAEAVGAGVR